MITRHFRNGRELPVLNHDNHYSTHFQEIRRLKRSVTVLPVSLMSSIAMKNTYQEEHSSDTELFQGDALITTCDYNSEDRDNITLGGYAISDEMCVNYVHYFPASDLEVCKSAISDQALATFFQYMHE